MINPALMLITVLGGTMDGSQSYLLYPSMADCDKATAIVSNTLAYDHTITCTDGGLVASLRPVRNPRYEVEE